MAVDERLRRLAPIVTGGVGFGVAALKMRAGGVSERELVACTLIALAAALVAYAVEAVRGSAGIIAGAVAGVWLAATAAAAAAAAAAASASASAAAAATATAAMCLLFARADKHENAPPVFFAPAAAALVVFEPRAWALALVAAGVVAWRERGRRRYLAAAPAIAALVGGIITMMAVFGRAPTWAPHTSHVGLNAWIEDAVDALGPVAIVVGAIGVAVAIDDRRARWTSMAIVAALLAALPLTNDASSTALVGIAMALGMALAAIAVRVGRTRNQALVGAALAAVMVTQLVI